jgi:glyoxylase-like metal-dependent hydrolase (beta-lactamase superfamily II)
MHLTWLGCPLEVAEELASQPFRALTFAHPLPEAITLKAAGDSLDFGGRQWRLHGGRGHSPSPLMFHAPDGKLLLAGDQILAGISPFVGTFGDAPLASPVRDYLGFLREDIRAIPDDVRVLAGHGDPFDGLHGRAEEIATHHEERFKHILTACSIMPHSIHAMLAKLFTRSLAGVLPLALAEILAHANLLVDQGKLHASEEAGVRLYRTV